MKNGPDKSREWKEMCESWSLQGAEAHLHVVVLLEAVHGQRVAARREYLQGGGVP